MSGQGWKNSKQQSANAQQAKLIFKDHAIKKYECCGKNGKSVIYYSIGNAIEEKVDLSFCEAVKA